ncbi:MAG: hypothetical protein JXB10_04475 [Pirellulales bacterium]|nr:hypothetical protein [Pirellulales bacterium]
MEKSKFAVQHDTLRWGLIRETILSRRNLFAASGTIVAAQRIRNGRRHGPYFHVTYRDQGRKKSLYLGASKTIACKARRLLDQLQNPRRSRRRIHRLRIAIRASLRNHHARLQADWARYGLRVKGMVVHKTKTKRLFPVG